MRRNGPAAVRFHSENAMDDYNIAVTIISDVYLSSITGIQTGTASMREPCKGFPEGMLCAFSIVLIWRSLYLVVTCRNDWPMSIRSLNNIEPLRPGSSQISLLKRWLQTYSLPHFVPSAWLSECPRRWGINCGTRQTISKNECWIIFCNVIGWWLSFNHWVLTEKGTWQSYSLCVCSPEFVAVRPSRNDWGQDALHPYMDRSAIFSGDSVSFVNISAMPMCRIRSISPILRSNLLFNHPGDGLVWHNYWFVQRCAQHME